MAKAVPPPESGMIELFALEQKHASDMLEAKTRERDHALDLATQYQHEIKALKDELFELHGQHGRAIVRADELQSKIGERQWIDARKRNPDTAGEYLTATTAGDYRIVRYGTSKKWQNGRENHLPLDSEHRTRWWMPLPTLPTEALRG